MERRRLGNTDLTISIIGLGCYGMSGAYGPADDAESIATSRRALDLGDQLSRPISQLRQGHRLIREAIRGRRHDVAQTPSPSRANLQVASAPRLGS
jgi:hypothetical protein